MLGIIVILGVSWMLLYFIRGKSLLILGFLPLKYRTQQLLHGFLFSALLCTLIFGLQAIINSIDLILNKGLSLRLLVQSLWWDTKSVLTEELIYRAALLYLLIHYTGVKKALLISATAFGVYHWFSYGVVGNLVPMVIVFFGTGIMGYTWALAYYKTKSIMMPIGLHLGWNIIQNTIFSKGPWGQIVLLQNNAAETEGIISLISFLLPLVIAPVISLLYVKYRIKNTNQSIE